MRKCTKSCEDESIGMELGTSIKSVPEVSYRIVSSELADLCAEADGADS